MMSSSMSIILHSVTEWLGMNGDSQCYLMTAPGSMASQARTPLLCEPQYGIISCQESD